MESSDIIRLRHELDKQLTHLDIHLTHRECDYVIAFGEFKDAQRKFLEYLEANENPDLNEIVDYALLIEGFGRPFRNYSRWIGIQRSDRKAMKSFNSKFRLKEDF